MYGVIRSRDRMTLHVDLLAVMFKKIGQPTETENSREHTGYKRL